MTDTGEKARKLSFDDSGWSVLNRYSWRFGPLPIDGWVVGQRVPHEDLDRLMRAAIERGTGITKAELLPYFGGAEPRPLSKGLLS